MSRFWTWLFFIFLVLSYVLVFPFEVRPATALILNPKHKHTLQSRAC